MRDRWILGASRCDTLRGTQNHLNSIQARMHNLTMKKYQTNLQMRNFLLNTKTWLYLQKCHKWQRKPAKCSRLKKTKETWQLNEIFDPTFVPILKEKGNAIKQQSPTFLAPGTSFVEENFSTDGVGGMVQAIMRVMRGGGMVQAVMRVMGSGGEGQMKLHSLICHSPPTVRPGS